MPVARTAIGCIVGVALLVGLALLVRPLVFTVAPPRDDSAVAVATTGEAAAPILRPVGLLEARGLDGEQPMSHGVQLTVIVAPAGFGQYTVVNAASPEAPDCPVEIAGDRLVDCGGREWTLDGTPLASGHASLERFATRVEDGAVIADLTRTVD